jgi:predicted transcriptional regulator
LQKTAGDLMIPLNKYPHVSMDIPISKALEIISSFKTEINGFFHYARAVLVFNENKELTGLVQRRDILKGLEPDDFFKIKPIKNITYDIEPDSNLLEASVESLINELREKSQKPISTIMEPIENTVKYNDHIFKIIYELHNYRIIPVMKKGEVVGILRSVEIINEINKIINE